MVADFCQEVGFKIISPTLSHIEYYLNKVEYYADITTRTQKYISNENEGDKTLRDTDGKFDLKLQVFNQ